ncbi:hypothetical protein ASF12_13865 [Paenibacillus sp. Leaf72]|nr:hypothetical protein ASF12_13865 [Paenibacillus sp. Leaf72]
MALCPYVLSLNIEPPFLLQASDPGETARAVLWQRGAFHSEKYRERIAQCYTFLYFKRKRLSPSFGGKAPFRVEI